MLHIPARRTLIRAYLGEGIEGVGTVSRDPLSSGLMLVAAEEMTNAFIVDGMVAVGVLMMFSVIL